MRKVIIPAAVMVVLSAVVWLNHSLPSIPFFTAPEPTNGKELVIQRGESEHNQDRREAWIEQMHRAAPGVDWRDVDFQTKYDRYLSRQGINYRSGQEILANGQLVGEWLEKGSVNQAGSVLASDYDAETDMIYLVSAGGTIWKGSRTGNDWSVVNQDLQFYGRYLKRLDHNGGKRMIAFANKVPHYSDDEGQTWNSASGVRITSRTYGGPSQVIDVRGHIFLLSKPGYWDDFKLYHSSDKGENYRAIRNMPSNNGRHFKLFQPNHTEDLYLIEWLEGAEESTLLQFDWAEGRFMPLKENLDLHFGAGGRANIAAYQQDSLLRFFAYGNRLDSMDQRQTVLWMSDDTASTWEQRAVLPASPWEVGLYISPSDPNFMVMGGVECFRSLNNGQSWRNINSWVDYYEQVNEKLHADMMVFNEFETADGDPFLLISNHGGLNVTYDKFTKVDNLGLEKLNVAQYYDVRTDPLDPSLVYAGSQDQGFQRGDGGLDREAMFADQLISGDYGHIAFSEDGRRLWTVYPGGWILYYDEASEAVLWQVDASYQIPRSSSPWIPPLVEGPDPGRNEVLLAGGGMDDEEAGSHIVRLAIDSVGRYIVPTEMPYDFSEDSNDGELSALRVSALDTSRWYAATDNGRFFYSQDAGQNWEQTLDFVPGGHYLYGATILPSKLDTQTVWYAGSGYSNPAVYKSIDGGFTFLPMVEGLPSTLVFELAANSDESMLFAATEAGPYVYVAADSSWYDMSGMGAPTQTYWSVEYVAATETVRFGTYGRGIWDFQIGEIVSNNNVAQLDGGLQVFPNPATDVVQVVITQSGVRDVTIDLMDTQGRLLQSWQQQESGDDQWQTEIKVGSVPPGWYVIRAEAEGQFYSQALIVQRSN